MQYYRPLTAQTTQNNTFTARSTLISKADPVCRLHIGLNCYIF